MDLWLQVASVKLLGFGSAALKTPEALAGTLAVPLLYRGAAGVRRARRAGGGARAGGAADRGDHRAQRHDGRGDDGADACSRWCCWCERAQSGAPCGCWAAAAALGIAFDVKLLESVVALPGLALFAWLGLPGLRAGVALRSWRWRRSCTWWLRWRG